MTAHARPAVEPLLTARIEQLTYHRLTVTYRPAAQTKAMTLPSLGQQSVIAEKFYPNRIPGQQHTFSLAYPCRSQRTMCSLKNANIGETSAHFGASCTGFLVCPDMHRTPQSGSRGGLQRAGLVSERYC